jgi:hypothetical protein
MTGEWEVGEQESRGVGEQRRFFRKNSLILNFEKKAGGRRQKERIWWGIQIPTK